MKHILLAMIRFYQLVFSSLTPRQCCFYPTCSAYGMEAIRRFGAAKGLYLTVLRFLRCHPFSSGGYDPVPEEWQNPLKNLGKRLGSRASCDKNPPIPPSA